MEGGGEADSCGLKSRGNLPALEKGRLMLDMHGGAKAEGSLGSARSKAPRSEINTTWAGKV